MKIFILSRIKADKILKYLNKMTIEVRHITFIMLIVKELYFAILHLMLKALPVGTLCIKPRAANLFRSTTYKVTRFYTELPVISQKTKCFLFFILFLDKVNFIKNI